MAGKPPGVPPGRQSFGSPPITSHHGTDVSDQLPAVGPIAYPPPNKYPSKTSGVASVRIATPQTIPRNSLNTPYPPPKGKR